MAYCDDDSDCRDDYICIPPSDRDARIVDQNPLGLKVCSSNTTLPDATIPDETPGVCEPGDPGEPWTPYDPGMASK
jgi:hypothetical protein